MSIAFMTVAVLS